MYTSNGYIANGISGNSACHFPWSRLLEDGVATDNLIDGYVYRSFHRNKCYELDVRIAFSNPANADPTTMKNFDLKTVHDCLNQVLETFKFAQ